MYPYTWAGAGPAAARTLSQQSSITTWNLCPCRGAGNRTFNPKALILKILATAQGRSYILHDANKAESEEEADLEGPAIGSEPLDISFDLPAGELTGTLTGSALHPLLI